MARDLIHLDLFSGIGGFAYAIDQVWDGVEHIFCEIDPFCQQVLKKHWKGSVIYGDIKKLTFVPTYAHDEQNGNSEIGRVSECEKKERVILNERPHILSAGCPCQPASQAGKRRGKEDDRWLWPETFRIIRETQPRFVVLENVRGILTLESGLVFKELLAEMEGCGYETRAYIIPAVAVNAPHRRDRIWIVAHARHRDGQRTKDRRKPKRSLSCQENAIKSERSNSDERKEFIGDTAGSRCNGRECDGQGGQVQDVAIGKDEKDKQERDGRKCGVGERGSDAPDAKHQRLQGGVQSTFGPDSYQREDWDKNWFEVATELCRVDDEFSAGLDFAGHTKAQHRVQRLKALGNAIVPAVAVEILKGIKCFSEK